VLDPVINVSEDTHQKALRINLDPRWYGTVAEIGAGQEVARWFFRVGGAAGTIAKSISAYDMLVSDAIYGEVDQIRVGGPAAGDAGPRTPIEPGAAERQARRHDFVFRLRQYGRCSQLSRGTTSATGGWGSSSRLIPGTSPARSSFTFGCWTSKPRCSKRRSAVVGINLLHGAFFLHHEPEELVESLLDRLTTGRIEIDMIEFRGIEFRRVDNRLMALKLVQLGLSGVAMFGADRAVLQPSEALRKKAVLVERGSFRPTTLVNIDMLETALAKFEADPAVAGQSILPLAELTMRNLLAGGSDVDRRDFLARADLLAACGMTVLISDYFEYYRLAAYIASRTTERIGIVMGVPSLMELFDEKFYTQLPGGILESFGRLFKNDLRIYVYPLQRSEDAELKTVDNLEVEPSLRPLYDYLAMRGSFVPLDNYRAEYLSIFSRDVLKRIATGDETWESMVPEAVANLIKQKSFFDYSKVKIDD
jgi:hypothetical protein